MRLDPRLPFPFLLPIVAAHLLAAGSAQEAQEPAAAGKPAEPVLAIFAGTVHPVSGPAFQDGVVVVRGERIVAVGRRGEVEVPDGATALSYPQGHVYPGLVDALTDAFTDEAQRGDGSTDAATALADGLAPRDDRQDRLLQAGITTAYVGSRSGAQWRGIGALVRPTADGFAVWQGRERAGEQLRLTAGPGNSHPLQRSGIADGVSGAFDSLEAYAKAFADHKTALEKYRKDFEAYLAFHRKKDGGPGESTQPASGNGDRTETRPGAGPGGRTRPGGGTRGPRPGGQGGGGGGERPPAETPPTGGQDPARTEPKPAEAKPAAGDPPPADPKPAEEKAPTRPTWPKEPSRDPVKDALQQVKEGALVLRVEAHRPDEIGAALDLRQKHQLPSFVLEQPYGGAALAQRIAEAGVACVLTDVAPGLTPPDYQKHDGYDTQTLPAALHQHGVAVAIASGSAARSAALPLQAAAAVGHGLPADAALRAITLTPAEILGVAHEVGSLGEGKYADLLVTDRPLFASDCRVLRVIAAGKTGFEAR